GCQPGWRPLPTPVASRRQLRERPGRHPPGRRPGRWLISINPRSSKRINYRIVTPRPGLSGRLAAVDGPALDLVLVEALVQVEPLEQELDHRRTHLRP